MEPDHTAREYAQTHHGVIGDRPANEVGLDSRRRGRRQRDGSLMSLSGRAMIVAGAPLTDKARAMAAVLDVRGRAYLSHTSAAWLWGIPGFDLDPIQVARHFEGTRRPSHLARSVPRCSPASRSPL